MLSNFSREPQPIFLSRGAFAFIDVEALEQLLNVRVNISIFANVVAAEDDLNRPATIAGDGMTGRKIARATHDGIVSAKAISDPEDH